MGRSRGDREEMMSSRRAWDREGKSMEGFSFQGSYEDRRDREAIVWQAEPSNRRGCRDTSSHGHSWYAVLGL